MGVVTVEAVDYRKRILPRGAAGTPPFLKEIENKDRRNGTKNEKYR